jgi:hypothetical protein
MRVVGGKPLDVSKAWRRDTGKEKDKPKTDLQIYHPNNPKYAINISKKQQNDSQVMSAQPEESNATYIRAAKTLSREMRKGGHSREATAEMRRRVGKQIRRVTRPLERMNSPRATPSRVQALKQLSHRRLQQLHQEYPDIARNVSYEARTGRGKHGGHLAAALALVNNDVRDISKNDPNDEHPLVIRASLPKGKGRPGVLRSSGRRIPTGSKVRSTPRSRPRSKR